MIKDDSCSCKECRKCHPRQCKYFRDNITCKFGKGCSNIHKDDSTKKEMDEIKEELKTLHTEITVLKDTVKSLTNIKKEKIFMVQVISELKEDILNIKDDNDKIAQNIGDLEK